MYYDLESMTTNKLFAKCTNPGAIIAMIQMRHVVDGEATNIVYALKKYIGRYNVNDFNGVIIKHFESEQLLCIHFLLFLQSFTRTTIVTGFNASGTFINGLTKLELEKSGEQNASLAALKTTN